MIGDVVSQAGCDFLGKKLPAFKRENGIDVVIANGENCAVGNGVLPYYADLLFSYGVDVLTGGNHIYKRREIYDYLENTPQLVRPANYSKDNPGNGFYIYDGGSYSLLVISVLGTSFMEPLENPFDTVDRILSENKATFTVVDIHAEATGEKKALGFYLDGRVSAVFGTHTHVQTADEQILPNGTGYITDVGMTGPYLSVLGVKPQNVIDKLKTLMPTRFETAEGDCFLNGVIAEFDKKTSLCKSIERVTLY